jgi:hypothetical protein
LRDAGYKVVAAVRLYLWSKVANKTKKLKCEPKMLETSGRSEWVSKTYRAEEKQGNSKRVRNTKEISGDNSPEESYGGAARPAMIQMHATNESKPRRVHRTRNTQSKATRYGIFRSILQSPPTIPLSDKFANEEKGNVHPYREDWTGPCVH